MAPSMMTMKNHTTDTETTFHNLQHCVHVQFGISWRKQPIIRVQKENKMVVQYRQLLGTIQSNE